jgi:hypothetical protein
MSASSTSLTSLTSEAQKQAQKHIQLAAIKKPRNDIKPIKVVKAEKLGSSEKDEKDNKEKDNKPKLTPLERRNATRNRVNNEIQRHKEAILVCEKKLHKLDDIDLLHELKEKLSRKSNKDKDNILNDGACDDLKDLKDLDDDNGLNELNDSVAFWNEDDVVSSTKKQKRI